MSFAKKLESEFYTVYSDYIGNDFDANAVTADMVLSVIHIH